MMSSPSAFTQRVYGVSFSVANFFAISSETMVIFDMLDSLFLQTENLLQASRFCQRRSRDEGGGMRDEERIRFLLSSLIPHKSSLIPCFPPGRRTSPCCCSKRMRLPP